MPPYGPYGWVDYSTPYINAYDLETMFAGGPFVFTPEAYGAARNGVTDDTAAIQLAINAAVAYAQSSGTYYAEVWFYPGIYQVASAATKGGTTYGNSQITLPICATTAQKITLVLRGIRDSSATLHWNQTVSQLAGAVLRSPLTGQTLDGTYGAVSVIGGPTAWTDPNAGGGSIAPGASFSNMNLVLDGLTIITPAIPTLMGVDGGYLAQMNVGTLVCSTPLTEIQLVAGGNFPTNSNSMGLRMPYAGNNLNCNIRNYTCYGYYYGIGFAENLIAQRISCQWTNTACWIYNPNSTSYWHGAWIGDLQVEGGVTIMQTSAGTGFFPIVVGLIDTELQTGTYDIVDANNTLYGEMSWSGDAGRNPKLNGANNLHVINVTQPCGPQTPPTVPLTTVALMNPFSRDAHVTITAGSGSTCAVSINGGTASVTIPASTIGYVLVSASATITLTYTSAPTWTWVLL